ncbi:hypothetical protein [Chlamydiifrater volucris]|uniref:hypothetical protein n=1 Tax=Chlamydiifrater volucris TaxID=2681470 RepID=UPI0032B21C23
MSISSPSEAGSPFPSFSPQPSTSSTENRIQANLRVIQELAEAQLLQISEEGAGLYSQIFSISGKGYDDELIAKACSVSQISLRALLTENQCLTEEQFKLVVSACQDIAESSGSSTMLSSKQKKKKKESQITAQLLSTPEHLPGRTVDTPETQEVENSLLLELLTKSSSSEKTLSTLKRSIPSQQSTSLEQQFEVEGPKKRQKISIHTLYKDVLPPSENTSPENDIKIITFLLDTIQEKMTASHPFHIHCPNKSLSELGRHTCPFCSWIRAFFGHRRSAFVKQMEIFLECASKEALARALVKLNFKNKGVFENKRLSSVQAAYLIAECGIGRQICLPDIPNPSSQVGLYQALETMVSEGIHQPLSQIIKQLWETTTGRLLPNREENATIPILRGEELCESSPITLQTLFLGVRYRPAHQRREGQRYISDSHVKFLAKLTFLTLKALLESPLGTPYTVLSGPHRAIPWHVVQHVHSLILVAVPKRRIAVLSSRASLGASEEIGLPFNEALEFFTAIRQFADANNLLRRRYLEE